MMRFFLLSFGILFSALSSAQTLNIPVSEHQFYVDHTHGLIVSRVDNITQFSDLSPFTEVVINLGRDTYKFEALPARISYKDSYNVIRGEERFLLYFTSLPLVSLTTSDSIVDEPKTYARFTYADDRQITVSNIGIEIRGGFSQTYPKKTYDLEFWKDETGESTKDVQFGTLRSDDDWVMDALYNEPLRLRSTIAHKLWLELHTPYYLEEEPEVKAGADVLFVELFLNGRYNGIYTLSEQVDRKLLKLKKFKDEEIRGELYKGNDRGATTFTVLPNFSNDQKEWAGYELKYPDTDDTIYWNKLYSFTDYVMNGSDQSFIDNIWKDFNKQNNIDYFIYLNLLSASDNTGKNIFLGRYTAHEPYFYIPWDLDGCLGTQWRGNRIGTTSGILSNALYDRLLDLSPDKYRVDLSDRWFDLRQGIITKSLLIDRVMNYYTLFTDHKIYERESIVYPNYEFNESDLNYTVDWISDRIDYLDNYFDKLTANIWINSTTDLSISPNPVMDVVVISGSFVNDDLPYSILNSSGHLIRSGRVKSNQIQMSTLRSGFYIIRIDNRSFKIYKQ